jgi:hypothetical protein
MRNVFVRLVHDSNSNSMVSHTFASVLKYLLSLFPNIQTLGCAFSASLASPVSSGALL